MSENLREIVLEGLDHHLNSSEFLERDVDQVVSRLVYQVKKDYKQELLGHFLFKAARIEHFPSKTKYKKLLKEIEFTLKEVE